MVKRIRHRGLRRLYEDGGTRGLNADHVAKLRLILAALDAAEAAIVHALPVKFLLEREALVLVCEFLHSLVDPELAHIRIRGSREAAHVAAATRGPAGPVSG